MNYRYFISPGPRFRLEAKFLAHIKIPSHLFLGENGFHYSLCFTIWKTKKKEWGGKKKILKKKKRQGDDAIRGAGVSSHAERRMRCLPQCQRAQGVTHKLLHAPLPGPCSWLRLLHLPHAPGTESGGKGVCKEGCSSLDCLFCLKGVGV